MAFPDWTTIPVDFMARVGAKLSMVESCSASHACLSWNNGLSSAVFHEPITFHLSEYSVEKENKLFRFIDAHSNQFVEVTIVIRDDDYDINSCLSFLQGANHLKSLTIERWADRPIDMGIFPHIPNLETLRLTQGTNMVGGVQDFCEYYSPRLATLELIQIPASVGSTWSPQHTWEKLEKLTISHSDTTVLPLILNTSFNVLEVLELDNTDMDETHFAALVDNSIFPYLVRINLKDNLIISLDALETWLTTPGRGEFLDKLEHLDLGENMLAEEALLILSRICGEDFKRIKDLSLVGATFTEAALEALSGAAWLYDMTLWIGEDDITEDGIEEYFQDAVNEYALQVIAM